MFESIIIKFGIVKFLKKVKVIQFNVFSWGYENFQN